VTEPLELADEGASAAFAVEVGLVEVGAEVVVAGVGV
jgi:hypothetical protein